MACSKEPALTLALDLVDRWLDVLRAAGEEYADWAAMIFTEWDRHILLDIIAETLDAVTEYALDNFYLAAVDLLPQTELQEKLQRLRQLRHRYE